MPSTNVVENLGIEQKSHPEDMGIQGWQEKTQQIEKNQEQHLDKNDFFTWKLSLSQLASH